MQQNQFEWKLQSDWWKYFVSLVIDIEDLSSFNVSDFWSSMKQVK